MEALRRWILLLCSGCILYGLLENLLPRRGVWPVIKAVAVLYILLVALSPVQSLALPENGWPPLEEASSALPTDPAVQEAFWRQTGEELQKTLSQALEEAGVDARLLEAKLSGENASVQLRLWVRDEAAQAAARQLCDSLFETAAEYEWEYG